MTSRIGVHMNKSLAAWVLILLAVNSTCSAKDVSLRLSMHYAFGQDGEIGRLDLGAAFRADQTGVFGADLPAYAPGFRFRVLGGEAPDDLYSSLHVATSSTGGSNWLWWTFGAVAAATVAVVAASGGSSGGDKNIEGTTTSICGRDSVLIGNMCVQRPR